jgi:hypothetical protein
VGEQSRGGIEAYSAAYKDERIKQVGIFNSGVFDADKRPMLAQIKQPIAFFAGVTIRQSSCPKARTCLVLFIYES